MKRGVTVILCGLAGIALCIYYQRSSETVDEGGAPQPSSVVDRQSDVIVLDTKMPVSPMAIALADPNRTARDDLKALGDIFRYYSVGENSTLPIGTNQEITKALTKSSGGGLPFLPEGHPRINPAGELVDRWDTPYFFHALSSFKMEVRSAGADKTFYTDDDLIWPEFEAKPLANPSPIFEEAISIR